MEDTAFWVEILETKFGGGWRCRKNRFSWSRSKWTSIWTRWQRWRYCISFMFLRELDSQNLGFDLFNFVLYWNCLIVGISRQGQWFLMSGILTFECSLKQVLPVELKLFWKQSNQIKYIFTQTQEQLVLVYVWNGYLLSSFNLFVLK